MAENQKYYEDCFAIHKRRGEVKCIALTRKFCETQPDKKCPFYCSKEERKERDKKYGKYKKMEYEKI